MTIRALACCLLLLSLAAPAFAGKYNETLNLGDAAPAWKDLPGIDGKKHSLADLKDKDVVVVVFTCNSCPAAVDYEDRIMAFTKQYAGADKKVAVIAINVNVIEEDRLPKMQERAKERGFNFPYLFDETQQIARAYGARYTPEFFVLNKERKIAYMGAMDDRDDPKLVKSKFLELAVAATLKGDKPATGETLGRGCMIRYLKKKPE
jgi:peroxiredoxin